MVEGDIRYDGNVFVGETGSVLGNITSEDISLSGTVNGNITSQTKLVIFPTGILIGNVDVPNFTIQENGKFDGNSKMTTNKVVNINSEKSKIAKSENK